MMMRQLDLRMPARPLLPLRLNGSVQAARMRRLEQLAEWRAGYAIALWHYRVASSSGYNREIVDTNYSRHLRSLIEAFHEAYRSTAHEAA